MDSSAISWLSEMGLDNPVFTDQFELMDSFDDEMAAILGQDFDPSCCLSPEKNSSSTSTLINIPSTNSITSLCSTLPVSESPEKPASGSPPKLQKPNDFSGFSTTIQALSDNRPSSAPIILNFGNANSTDNHQQAAGPARALNADEEAAVVSEMMKSTSAADADEASKQAQNTKKMGGRVKAPSQTYDHIVAERKRREQLSQRFVALSTIVPGLKKTDKTSVLGDAIKYLKYLQERVKILEEQAMKKTMESVVLVTKSRARMEDDKKIPMPDEQPLPEIEARLCNSQILIRVHCEYQKGLLTNLIGKVEKLNLTIVNTNVASFGKLALDITIITEMEKEFNLTVNEVVKRIRAALQDTL